MNRESTFTRQLKSAMADYGYRYEGTTLIQNAIRGFTSARVMGTFRSAMAAAEWLRPIIKDEDYSRRLERIETDAADFASSTKYGF